MACESPAPCLRLPAGAGRAARDVRRCSCGPPTAGAGAARAASDPAAAPALVELGAQVRDYVRSLPLRAGATPLKFAPDYERWLIEAMSHGDYDDFWKDHGSSVVDHLAEYK